MAVILKISDLQTILHEFERESGDLEISMIVDDDKSQVCETDLVITVAQVDKRDVLAFILSNIDPFSDTLN